MTGTKVLATAAALIATLGLAAASWGVVVPRMSGMDMGVATPLGPFASFIVMWVLMMAAMMLPGVVPQAMRLARADGRATAVLVFVGSYVAVWALFGAAAYAVYRPPATFVAGVITIAAGLYEFTQLKQHFRRRCCETVHSGLGFGLYCVGSSIGLMLMQVALGLMSITWMCVITAVVVAQKLLPPKAGIDAPVALAIVGLGILILVDPSAVPGLMTAK